MPIRITGMNSGLETDKIIQELIKAKSEKLENTKKAQTKLSWTQDKWKTTNSKIYSFYSKYLSDMRYEASYKKKSTSISNTNVASVIAGDSAVNGSQSLVVKQLAKAGYLTGGKLSSDKSVKSTSTLNDKLGAGLTGEGTIEVKVKGKTSSITIDGNSSITDVVSKLTETGLQASFDATNQRIFVSVADSGAQNDFTMTATNSEGLKALSALGLVTSSGITNNAEYTEWSGYYADSSEGILNNIGLDKIAAYTSAKATNLQKNVSSLADSIKEFRKTITETQEKLDKEKDSEAYKSITGSTFAEKKENVIADLSTAQEAITTNSEKLEYIALSEKDPASLTDDQKETLTKYNEKYGDVSSLNKEELITEQKELSDSLKLAQSNVKLMTAIGDYQKTIDTAETSIYDAYSGINNNVIALNTYYNTLTSGTTLTDVNNQLEYIELSAKKTEDLTSEESEKLASYTSTYGDVEALNKEQLTAKAAAFNNLVTNQALMDEATQFVADTGKEAFAATSTIDIQMDTESELVSKAQTANEIISNATNYSSDTAVRVMGQDAIINLNGAEFQSTTNNFTVNELTITAKQVSNITGYQTVDGEEVPIYEEASITTSDDINGIYDMVKSFIKQYNELIKELDTAYNADSAKGYEPLSDEEKESMSDDEIEKWEKKVKDALLKGDSDLGNVISGLKASMLSSFEIGGTKYSLANFGIETLGYFNSEENERGVFHIDGDSEDSTTSGEKDILKAMISKDPDAVTTFFTKLSNTLYDKLTGQMRTTAFSSIYTVYQDKKMKSDYDDYDDKIAQEQKKLNETEDKYYKQFSAMEKALSKLNSQQSSLTSMLGQ